MNRQIVDEAAEWFVEFNTGEPDLPTRRRFDTWLRTSPEHLRAFLDLIETWEDGARIVPREQASIEALVAWARAGDPVVSLATARCNTAAGANPRGRWSRVRRKSWQLSSLAATVCVFVGLFAWLLMDLGPTYTTAAGEQRSITLTDGSVVELNARTQLRLHFTKQERAVELIQGQALFRVAKDAGRPFVVQSADARARAVGTEFDVNRRGDASTTITVVEGRVEVTAARPEALLLSMGEQVTVAKRIPLHPVLADVSAVTAWTQRQLVFAKTPLVEVAEDFNRYNTRHLTITDAAVQRITISGVFSSTDPTSLLRFLRAQPGLQVIESRDEIRVTRTNSTPQ